MNVHIEDLKQGKVKLEFGNLDQIEVIRRADEELNKKNYIVTIMATAYLEIIVRAKDEKDAANTVGILGTDDKYILKEIEEFEVMHVEEEK